MSVTIVWFRQDLRLTDNPALTAALHTDGRVIPLFIDSSADPLPWRDGAASRWWLHHSLTALSAELARRGSGLVIRRGPAERALRQLITETKADKVVWNRLYEPAHIARDQAIKRELKQRGVAVESFNGALLHEPWQVVNASGEPYRVFTPYWKALQRSGLEFPLSDAAATLPPLPDTLESVPVAELGWLPRMAWDAGFRPVWTPGEAGAQHQLERFLKTALADYTTGRDFPDRPGTSRLSPHLHFGELGPRQIAVAVLGRMRHFPSECPESQAFGYLREIAWREFAHHLLYHFPSTAEQPLDARFNDFPWTADDGPLLRAWQTGQTGYPWVDAGMRELWQTGWMHNRVRMAVASLLTKNLRLPWQHGARWFWDTLVDADLANNSLGWQWSAGCGADAAPYFRIFNPVLQGQRFDPEGTYLRTWVPELNRLPDRYLHQPWTAPPVVLREAGIELGTTYPLPVVDLKQSREAALAAFALLKEAN
jgi:deoxyribodipyrimidine photo-lyase